jgi:hypothetical protein
MMRSTKKNRPHVLFLDISLNGNHAPSQARCSNGSNRPGHIEQGDDDGKPFIVLVRAGSLRERMDGTNPPMDRPFMAITGKRSGFPSHRR